MLKALDKYTSAEIITFPKRPENRSNTLFLQPNMNLPEMNTDHEFICESCKL